MSHYTLGFSPCPNDTFIFDALVNGKIDTEGCTFDVVLEDVATLNEWAEHGKLDITKLSYSTFLKTVNSYALLHSGSALGKGVGPLLIAASDIKLTDLEHKKIAIPGFNTTANLLLTLALPDVQQKTAIIFSDIESEVLKGNFDAGLVIHESRFTYQSRGLTKLMDLGDWWEQVTGAAIPLGGIVMKRSFEADKIAQIDRLIRRSIEYAYTQYPQLSEYITCHAQEMEPAVMRQHIDLYVNEYSIDLGVTGRKAIQTLFEKAQAAGLLQHGMPENIFYPGV